MLNLQVKRDCLRATSLVVCLAAVPLSACGSTSHTAGAGSTAHSASVVTPATPSATATFDTGPAPGGVPQRGGSLVFSTQGSLTTLDPALNANTNQYASELPLFDQLVADSASGTAPIPDLAVSWTISSDQKVYTFRLRPGVRFSNGQPLTSADVIFSFTRLAADVKHGLVPLAYVTGPIASVTALGSTSVRFTLNKVTPAFLDDLTDPFCSIVPQAVVAKIGSKAFGLHPEGTGPFLLKSFQPGVSEHLVANPYYWRSGQPYLKSLSFNEVANATQRILSVQAGQAQVADYVPFPQVPAVQHLSGARLLVQPYWAEDAIYETATVPPFGDRNVRLALLYATPISAIIKTAYSGDALPANSILPKIEYWDSSVPVYPYDVAKAKQYLAASSRPHGFSTTLYVVGGDPQSALVAQILQSSWAAIGVHLQIRQEDLGTLETNQAAGKLPLAWYPSGAFSSFTWAPDAVAAIAYDSSVAGDAGTLYRSASQTKLVREAESSPSNSTRAADFARLQRLAYQTAQFMPVAFPPSLSLVSTSIRGYNTTPAGLAYLQGVWLSGT